MNKAIVSAQDTLRIHARKLIIRQLAIGIVVALGFYLYRDFNSMLAAAYGSGVAMVLGVMLQVDISRADRESNTDPTRGMFVLYIGAVQRFVVVLLLFSLGLAWLGLKPLAVIAGFTLAQLCYALLARQKPQHTQEIGRI